MLEPPEHHPFFKFVFTFDEVTSSPSVSNHYYSVNTHQQYLADDDERHPQLYKIYHFSHFEMAVVSEKPHDHVEDQDDHLSCPKYVLIRFQL